MTAGEWLKDQMSITFDEAVEQLRDRGYKVKDKILVKLGSDGHLRYNPGETFPLDCDYPLGDGEFWLPWYFNGKQWTHKLVAPPWMDRDKVSDFFSAQWGDSNPFGIGAVDLSEDPKEYIMEERRKYSKLGGRVRFRYMNYEGETVDLIRPGKEVVDYGEMAQGGGLIFYDLPGSLEAYTASDCLREVVDILSGPQIDEDGRTCFYPPPKTPLHVWRAVEVAYHAGRAAQQADSAEVYELAKKAPSTKPKKSLYNLKPWEKRVRQLLTTEVTEGERKFPRSEMLSILTAEGLNKTKPDEYNDGKTELLEGEARWMTFKQFSQRVSEIAKLMKAHKKGR